MNINSVQPSPARPARVGHTQHGVSMSSSKVLSPSGISQCRQPQTAIWIGRAAIGCALLAILKTAQYFMNAVTSDVDCSGSPGYYRFARWWSASASYCLAEELLKQSNPSPETFEAVRKLLIEAAQGGLLAAIHKLDDCSLYPVVPGQAEIDLLIAVAYPNTCPAILPWSETGQEGCSKFGKKRN